MKARYAVLCICMALFAKGARADFFTYSEWEALPPIARASYISGAFDALISIQTSPNETYQDHYRKCLVQQKMLNSQLAEHVREYASARPDLQSRGVVAAMLNYLVALCGKPPPP